MITIQSRIGKGAITEYGNLEIVEELKGSFTVSFVALNTPKNEGYKLLIDEAVVTYEGMQFRVKQMQEKPTYKQITAYSTFFDIGGVFKHDIYGGTKTFNEFLAYALKDTGWRSINVDVGGSYFIPNYGNANSLNLLNGLMDVGTAEYKIEKNSTITVAKRIGPDNKVQYRYKANVKEIEANIDSTNLRTVITGFGANGLKVVYKSPNVSLFGEIEADPIVNEEIFTTNDMVAFLKTQLQDYPDMSMSLTAIEIVQRELGETVYLNYEPMGIQVKTRILSKKSVLKNKKLVTESVVLGTKLPKSNYDVIAGQQQQITESRNEYRSKIEQTNDRITLEVEKIGESIAQIEINADSLELRVAHNEGDITRHESSINLNSQQIELRVKEVDYNGNEIATRINMSSTTIDIQGSKINLIGAVTVLSDITGNLGTITAGTINGINLNGVYINTSQDIHIGNSLYFNNAVGNITAGSNGIAINSFGGYVYLNGTVDFQNQSSVNYGNIRVGIANVATTANHVNGYDVSGVVDEAQYAKNAGTANGTYVDYDTRFIYVRNSAGTILARADRVSGA